MEVKIKIFEDLTMTESFAQLFEESLQSIETRPGAIVRGVVVAIDKDVVLVDAGLKSESAIPVEQFKNVQGELEIQVGDEIDVALDAVEDGFGETILSREKAKRHEAWLMLEKAYEDAETVMGIINGKVKGGFTVELKGIRAFYPVLWLMFAQFVTQLTWKVKSLSSKLSNWIRNAITLLFPVVLLLSLKAVQNVITYWKTCRKAWKLRVLLRT